MSGEVILNSAIPLLEQTVELETNQRFKFHNRGEFLDESKTGVTAGVSVVSFTGSNARLA